MPSTIVSTITVTIPEGPGSYKAAGSVGDTFESIKETIGEAVSKIPGATVEIEQKQVAVRGPKTQVKSAPAKKPAVAAA